MKDTPIKPLGYTPPVNQLLSLGQPRGHDFTSDYAALGITSEHVPELLRMVADEGLHNASGESKLTAGGVVSGLGLTSVVIGVIVLLTE